jgi:hypothetical protein
MLRPSIALIALLILFCTNQVFAHARLKTPTPRNNFTSNKTRALPCGGAGGSNSAADTPKAAPVITYTEGQEIDILWEETVPHEGNYEFTISSNNDATFMTIPGGVFADVNPNKRQWVEKLKLPAGITCENCTLRMIQNMNDDPNQPYKSCSDIKIVAAAGSPINPPVNTGGGDQGSQDNSSTTPGGDLKPQLGSCGTVSTKGGPGGMSGGGIGMMMVFVVMLMPLVLLARERKLSYARNKSRMTLRR